MRSRSIATGSFVCAGLVLMTACTGTTSGTPSTPPANPATSPSLPYAGAPGVDVPLDTSSIDAEPCNAATAAEIEALGGAGVRLTESDPVNAKDKQCTWTLNDGFGVLTAGMMRSGDGLSDIYDAHAKGQYSVFQPKPPVEGYPAVLASDRSVSDGFCTLIVGVRNDATYSIPISLRSKNPGYSDPCSVAAKLAAVVIKRLRGA